MQKATLKAMNENYNISTLENSEIKFRYYMKCKFMNCFLELLENM